jgi:hypothetical protein
MAKKRIKKAKVVSNKSKALNKLDWWSSLWGKQPLAVAIVAAVAVGFLLISMDNNSTKSNLTGKVFSTNFVRDYIINSEFTNDLDGWREAGTGSWRVIHDTRYNTKVIEQISKSKNGGIYQNMDVSRYGSYMVIAKVRAVGDSRCAVWIQDNSGKTRQIRSTSNKAWTMLTNTNVCHEDSDCRVVAFNQASKENTCQFDYIRVTRYN